MFLCFDTASCSPISVHNADKESCAGRASLELPNRMSDYNQGTSKDRETEPSYDSYSMDVKYSAI